MDPHKGKPSGEIAAPLKRREGEQVIYPQGVDKFWGGELDGLLEPKGIKTLIITGSSAHIAVLHTAVTAARAFNYNVIIPMDGTVARRNYEVEYTFHHLSVLPGGAGKLVQLTKLATISFQ